MISGVHNFTIDQGATFSRTITVKNYDESLYNLTGHTARMQIRRQIEDTTVMLELTTENGRITLGGAAGTIELLITAADTSTLTTSGVYDLELVEGAVVKRLIRGNINLNLEVTR
ncbi:MAG: hypothetical protein O2981_05395 [Proteobacteria bacterium]|nr:hypothetical protein [Pseudomonadota bacterium]